MKNVTWQEFFKGWADDAIPLRNYGGCDQVTVEDLYQHFKARLTEEISNPAEMGVGAANEFDPNLPQYLWSERRSRHEGAKQNAASPAPANTPKIAHPQ